MFAHKENGFVEAPAMIGHWWFGKTTANRNPLQMKCIATWEPEKMQMSNKIVEIDGS
jgi:hypothetical protein